MQDLSILAALDHASIAIAIVSAVSDDDTVMVECQHPEVTAGPCDVLQTTEEDRLRLEPGDRVLVLGLGTSLQRGIILGRIGLPRTLDKLVKDLPTAATPDELVLEAKHSLTLRVGEGSITIREDGRILIKGKDLVSHAQRLNRIKGGAVSIN